MARPCPQASASEQSQMRQMGRAASVQGLGGSKAAGEGGPEEKSRVTVTLRRGTL